MDWTNTPPTSPGVYGAVSDQQAGTFTFTPSGRAFAFGLDYWDWNDTTQRSAIRVTLSNGVVRAVTGPTADLGAQGGFIGFQLDVASVYTGIKIASVTWYALPSALPSQLSFWNGDIDTGGTDANSVVAPTGLLRQMAQP